MGPLLRSFHQKTLTLASPTARLEPRYIICVTIWWALSGMRSGALTGSSGVLYKLARLGLYPHQPFPRLSPLQLRRSSSAMSSPSPIDATLLARMKTLYPTSATDAHDFTWALVAISAFSAANLPEAVPQVFAYALEGETSHETRLRFARSARDAIFKTGMLSGYPKVSLISSTLR